MRGNKTIIAFMCVMLPMTNISFATKLRSIGLSYLLYKSGKGIAFDEHAIIFEKYDKTKNLKERKERLDAFAFYLKENPHFQGYIISYGGRRACIGEARARGEGAKNYLIKIKGIDANRIVIMDGGFYEEWMVELWAGARGAPNPTPMPTVDPNDVRVIKNCSVRNNTRRSYRSSSK
jgi:hypothetical protein